MALVDDLSVALKEALKAKTSKLDAIRQVQTEIAKKNLKKAKKQLMN